VVRLRHDASARSPTHFASRQPGISAPTLMRSCARRLRVKRKEPPLSRHTFMNSLTPSYKRLAELIRVRGFRSRDHL
jgi:hypothetical protein